MKTIALTCSSAANEYYIRPRYIRYIEQGAALFGEEIIPVILPITEKASVIRTYAGQFDGYLFTGGNDVEPWRYGEEKLPVCGETEADRDAFELALLDELIARDRPVFGICRGCQIMNTAFGGSLWQDYTSMMPLSAPHAAKDENGSTRHPVSISGFLADLIGKTDILTNSYHHQSVKQLGNGLVRCGVSSDGVTEAIAHPQLRFYRAVQWHPEIDPDEISRTLITAFLRAL